LTAQVNDRVPTNGIVRVSNNVERVTILEDGSVVFKPPPNSFADWDFGRVLNRYVDDSGHQIEVKELSPVERQSLCRMVIGGEIHEVSHANDKVFARRLRGHTIVMPCNVAQVLRTRVETLPRTDIANWVKVIFQGTPQTYATKIAAQLNHGRVRMEYDTVVGHIKKLQQTGVYKDLKLASKEDCQWDENVNAIQKEVAVFNDHRATVHEAKVRSDTAQQWDPSCDVKQDKVCVCGTPCLILIFTFIMRRVTC